MFIRSTYLFKVGPFVYQQRVGYSLLCCFVVIGFFPFSKTSYFVLIALIFVFSFPYAQDQNCYFTPSLGMSMPDIVANR